MKWIKTDFPKEELPKDKVFLALWKGAFALMEFDEDENRFYLCYLPGQMDGIMRMDNENLRNISHWAELVYPEDY